MDPNARARPSQDLSTAEKMQLREVFAIVDQDGSNALDWMELRDALRGLGFPVTKRDVKALYAAADKNPRDLLEFDGFLTIVTALGRTEVQHEQEILQAFPLFDKSKTGKISCADLQQLCKGLGIPLPDATLREMIQEADLDGDGEISKTEFLKVIQRTNLYS